MNKVLFAALQNKILKWIEGLVLPHLSRSCTSWIQISRETQIFNFEDKHTFEISSLLLFRSSPMFFEQTETTRGLEPMEMR